MKQRESITGPLSEDDYAKVVERVRLLATACILPAYYLHQACTHQQRQMRRRRQQADSRSQSSPCPVPVLRATSRPEKWAGQGPGWHPRITSTRDRTPPVTRSATTFSNHVPGARRVPGLGVTYRDRRIALPPAPLNPGLSLPYSITARRHSFHSRRAASPLYLGERFVVASQCSVVTPPLPKSRFSSKA